MKEIAANSAVASASGAGLSTFKTSSPPINAPSRIAATESARRASLAPRPAGERRVRRDTGQGHCQHRRREIGHGELSRGGVLNAHRDGQEDDHGVAASGSDVMGREGRDDERTGDE
jgi:hypothetical protein